MAYTYKPNKYVKYDDTLTFEENYKNGAVITKEKLDKLEQQVKESSAEIAVRFSGTAFPPHSLAYMDVAPGHSRLLGTTGFAADGGRGC